MAHYPRNLPKRRSEDLTQRVGDAERDITLQELVRHFSAGRLSEEELDQRTEAALVARTRSDLYLLMSDLPRLPSTAPSRPPAHFDTPRSVVTGVVDAFIGFVAISAAICLVLLMAVSLSMTNGELVWLAAFGSFVATGGINYLLNKYRGNNPPR